MTRHLGALLIFTALSGPALAQPSASPKALDWARLQMTQRIQQPPHLWSIEQVDAFLRPAFLAASNDGRRITAEDRETAEKAARAQMRQGAMSLFILADLDGTGRVDRAKLRAALARTRGRQASQSPPVEVAVERYLLEADADRDGVVTYQEAVAAADRQSMSIGSPNGMPPPPELDLDGDGVTTLEEFQTVLRLVFDEIDTDRDGRLSEAEAKRFHSETLPAIQRDALARAGRERAIAAARANAGRCAVPTWDPATILAVVSAGHGPGLADVSIGDEANASVFAIHVEPGEKRLSIVLDTSAPAIWQFSGETARVAAVYVEQRRAGASQGADRRGWRMTSGVVGIDAAKVRFAPSRDCLLDAGSRAVDRDLLAAALGRPPDIVVRQDALSTAHLPSGATLDDGAFPNLIAFPKDGAGGPLWTMAARSGGALVHIDPGAVVALQPARRAPLPGVAGLARLADEGSARISAWQSLTRFIGPSGERGSTIVGDATIIAPPVYTSVTSRIPSEVMLLAPVALPPGLRHSDIRRLVVARGVQAPTGDLKAMCVVREEDATPVEGSKCD